MYLTTLHQVLTLLYDFHVDHNPVLLLLLEPLHQLLIVVFLDLHLLHEVLLQGPALFLPILESQALVPRVIVFHHA